MALEEDNRIITECYLDREFILALFKIKPNAQHTGIGAIAQTLSSKYQKQKAFVVIDNDKNIGPHFKAFKRVEYPTKLNIELLKDPKLEHYCVRINPAIEKWLLGIAERFKIDPYKAPYFLGNNFDAFKKRTKNMNLSKDQQMRNFINALIQKKPKEFDQLIAWRAEVFKAKKK
jgi:hypothetical protein